MTLANTSRATGASRKPRGWRSLGGDRSLVCLATSLLIICQLSASTITTTLTLHTAGDSVESQPKPKGILDTTNTTTTTITTPNTTTTAAPAIASETAAPTTTDSATLNQTATGEPNEQQNPTTTSGPGVVELTTVREPTEQEINEARKIIQEVASTIKMTNPHRLAMNKPLMGTPQADFSADSMEAHVSDATSEFGLNLMRTFAAAATNDTKGSPRDANTVLSPLSLQILLNMLLLGTNDQSATQMELSKVLNYEVNELSLAKDNNRTATVTQQQANTTATATATSTPIDDKTRLERPHEAIHNVVESIVRATHLAVAADNGGGQVLMNTNQHQLQAHLAAPTTRDNELPLSEQVNFTLANLMLTNKELIETSAEYENDLKKFYDVKLEQFSRKPPVGGKNESTPTSSSSTTATTATAATTVTPEKPLHERVNEWVRNITRNQITELADESSLSEESLALVLLNAAHFKGRWLHTFNTRLTHERPFYNLGSPDSAAETKFMRQKGVFGYAEFLATGQSSVGPATEIGTGDGSAVDAETLLTDDRPAGSAPTLELSREETRRLELTAHLNCSALMLPMSLNEGQELSMVILLPGRRDGLDELLGQLSAPTLNEIYKSLSEQQVQVDLPKFAFEAKHDVKALLSKLGLRRLFEAGADLGRMFAAKSGAPAKVDRIVHKAKIAVDEQGAEAAAASMATVVLRSSIRFSTPNFVADHPFLFVIRHNRSNMPLFMGQVRAF